MGGKEEKNCHKTRSETHGNHPFGSRANVDMRIAPNQTALSEERSSAPINRRNQGKELWRVPTGIGGLWGGEIPKNIRQTPSMRSLKSTKQKSLPGRAPAVGAATPVRGSDDLNGTPADIPHGLYGLPGGRPNDAAPAVPALGGTGLGGKEGDSNDEQNITHKRLLS